MCNVHVWSIPRKGMKVNHILRVCVHMRACVRVIMYMCDCVLNYNFSANIPSIPPFSHFLSSLSSHTEIIIL